jgi:hypothetical protein
MQRVPLHLEMSMEEVLFNFFMLFFAVSGLLAWSAILLLGILYFFIYRDLLKGFDKDTFE